MLGSKLLHSSILLPPLFLKKSILRLLLLINDGLPFLFGVHCWIAIDK